MCLSDVRHIIVSPNIKRSLSMFKKFLIIQSVIIILFLNITSSFVYAGFFSDNIETHTVPAPTVPSDGNLLSNDELVTEFNEEYFNDNHLVEDETEAGETFDEKAEFHTTENLSGLPNSSKSTNDELRSPASNIANSTKVTEISQQLVENGIMTISDDDYSGGVFTYNFPDGWNGNYNQGRSSYYERCVNISVDDCYTYIVKFLKEVQLKDVSYDESLLDKDNFILFRNVFESHYYNEKSYHGDKFNSYYCFLFTLDDDVHLSYSSSSFSTLSNLQTYIFGAISFCFSADDPLYGICPSVNSSSFNKSFSSGGFFYSYDSFPSLLYCPKDLYINDEIQDVIDPETGFTTGKIKGEFGFKENSKILTYKAWSDKELDNTFDVHLWAMDNPSVPAKINGNEDFPIRDLDNYDSHGLQLSASKSSVQASYELEAVYYYLHHMKGYDDSLESVDGYDFEEFESRENLNFAIAYRENGSSGDWIVCKSYQYNYGDLIENVMGSFTVKKDYVDFPDMSDYIEDYESWDDVAADCADENGEYNIIEVGFKWIGRNVMHFAHNFVGFFQWLFDCVPILWENLTIALYNLVCDLKELALYFVNPKTKSIYAMTCERIPSFSLLVDSFKNNNSSTLPSFTFFGTKFSLNFSDYDIDFSFIRNISTILFYLLFGCFVFKLIFKIFGFGSGGGDED